MRRWILVVVALFAVSCAGPEPPERWTVERQADDTSGGVVGAICTDVESVALGSLAAQDDLSPVLEELSRLAAVLGATAALPAFETLRDAANTSGAVAGNTGNIAGVDVRSTMLPAATALDDRSWEQCEIPLFTAMYAATSWPDCHGEVDVAVTLYMAPPDPDDRRCTTDGIPAFLPCWSLTDEGYLPIDCLSDAIVIASDGDWVEAGESRAPTPTTTTTTTTTIGPTETTEAPPPLIEAIERPECTEIIELFVGDNPLRGDGTDMARITDSTSLLGGFIVELASSFESANGGGWTLEAFESLVIDLDAATAEECGIPLMSAALLLVGGVEELPCWRPTGNAYPSFEPVSCDQS